MTLYGYARVSTHEQDFTLQEQALRAAGCEVIRAEKVTGTSRTNRPELQVLLDFLRRAIRWLSPELIGLRVVLKTFKTLCAF